MLPLIGLIGRESDAVPSLRRAHCDDVLSLYGVYARAVLFSSTPKANPAAHRAPYRRGHAEPGPTRDRWERSDCASGTAEP